MNASAYPILWDSGVYLPEQGIWLDPQRPRPRAVLSHAHSDHVAPHAVAYSTPETTRLISRRRRMPTRFEALPYGERRSMEGAWLTLVPAGHVLGSAQAIVETTFGRVVYTGDLKTRPGFTTSRAESVSADILIIESTFGKPRYVFPPAEEVIAEILEWCHAILGTGHTPVLLGYSLGKGQEILCALRGSGLEIALHPVLHSVTDVYRELDSCLLPEYRQLEPGASLQGTVVLCPPAARRGPLMRIIPNQRTAAITGWAVDDGLRSRLEVDACFPLSDHADFRDLCQYAEAVSANMTFTVLGFEEDLALALRKRGLRAAALSGTQQLSLF